MPIDFIPTWTTFEFPNNSTLSASSHCLLVDFPFIKGDQSPTKVAVLKERENED